MGSEIWTHNHPKSEWMVAILSNCLKSGWQQSPDFVCLGFQMIWAIAKAIAKPFENGTIFQIWSSKTPVFECFQIKNGQISDPHCTTIVIHWEFIWRPKMFSIQMVWLSYGSVWECDLNSEQFFVIQMNFTASHDHLKTKLLVLGSGIQKVWIFNGGPYECQITICWYSDESGLGCLVLKSCIFLANRKYILKWIQVFQGLANRGPDSSFVLKAIIKALMLFWVALYSVVYEAFI